MAISEPLGTGSDSMQPELLPVDYDHDAMVEYMREAAAPYPTDSCETGIPV